MYFFIGFQLQYSESFSYQDGFGTQSPRSRSPAEADSVLCKSMLHAEYCQAPDRRSLKIGTNEQWSKYSQITCQKVSPTAQVLSYCVAMGIVAAAWVLFNPTLVFDTPPIFGWVVCYRRLITWIKSLEVYVLCSGIQETQQATVIRIPSALATWAERSLDGTALP